MASEPNTPEEMLTEISGGLTSDADDLGEAPEVLIRYVRAADCWEILNGGVVWLSSAWFP